MAREGKWMWREGGGLTVVDFNFLYSAYGITDLSNDMPNPGLVGEGTKCGDEMVCIMDLGTAKCMDLSTLNSPTCPVGSNGVLCSGPSRGVS